MQLLWNLQGHKIVSYITAYKRFSHKLTCYVLGHNFSAEITLCMAHFNLQLKSVTCLPSYYFLNGKRHIEDKNNSDEVNSFIHSIGVNKVWFCLSVTQTAVV